MTASAAEGAAGRPEKWLSSEQALKLAWKHFHAGRLEDAERIARELATLRRIPVDALQILGLVAYRTGRAPEAVHHLERAVKGVPGNASLHANLAEFRRVAGDLPGAVQAARRALAIDPKHPQGLNNLGVALLERGRHDEAEPHFRALLEIKPDHAEAWNNLGNLLAAKGRFTEAGEAYDRAVLLRPSYPEALANAAQMHRRQGRLVQAEGLLRRAIAVNARHASARASLGRLRLLAGDAAEGWRESEWRLAVGGARPADLPGRPWEGGPVAGRRILIHAEPDLGETLLFARFLPALLDRGPAGVVLLVPPALRRLLQSAFPAVEVVTHAPADVALTAAVGSLPLLLGLADRAVPTDGAPWLAAPADRLEAWRARLPGASARRIGLAWSEARPGPLAEDSGLYGALAAALAAQGHMIVTLQTPPAGGPAAEDVSARLGDLADTASVIALLDGVIAADNAVAHLAGALGRPTVLLLGRTDWPWPAETASPSWYVTVRPARRAEGEALDAFVARAAAMVS